MEGITAVRGMRDLFGEDLEKVEYIKEVFERKARLYGYSKIELPVVEYFKLFEVKSGEEIRESMYTFLDKAGRELALRPEMTPGTVRAYIEHFQHLPKPVRLYYYGTVYRYDEPQFGRYREFRQAGVEMIGSQGLAADLEVIHLLASIYEELGLIDRIKLKLNNIGIYRKLFQCANIEERQQEHLLHLIDKNKTEEALKIVQNTRIYEVLATLLDRKEEEAVSSSEEIGCSIKEELDYVKNVVDLLKGEVPGAYYNVGFVRGLAYYTGIIFEVEHPSVPFSIAGGGRYDGLVEVYGAAHTPALGFAIGVERTALVLEKSRQGKEELNKAVILLMSQDKRAYEVAIHMLRAFHEIGVKANFSLKSSTSISKLIPDFLKEGYTHLVIVGLREVSGGFVTVKNLLTKQQYEIRYPLDPESLKQIF
ncbi:MAG: histidine--tRNA ligase [Thermoprotei archaeon]